MNGMKWIFGKSFKDSEKVVQYEKFLEKDFLSIIFFFFFFK